MEVWQQGAVRAAQQLIGHGFYVREPDGSLTGGMISETEAYTAQDAASHSFRGQTPRNSVMFGSSGRLYVYFTYGMHWCANIVTGPEGAGEAVLIRSLAPEQGVERMRQRRAGRPDAELANGPAKLCQALDISGTDNGAGLGEGRFIITAPEGLLPEIQATERIGIRQDRHRLWRFVATP